MIKAEHAVKISCIFEHFTLLYHTKSQPFFAGSQPIRSVRERIAVYSPVLTKHTRKSHHHRHVPEGLGMLSCSLILKMKLVPPSLPRSSYVPSSFWFIL